jgi:exodeoxyribonuclease V gamma subunit
MCGHGQALFENILPYDHMEGNDTHVLGGFLDFTENLITLAETLQQPHTLAEWSEVLLHTKDTLLLTDEKLAV